MVQKTSKQGLIAGSFKATAEKQAQRMKETKAKAKAAQDNALKKFAYAVLAAAQPKHDTGRALSEDEIVALVAKETARLSSAGRIAEPMPAQSTAKDGHVVKDAPVTAPRLPTGA